MGNTSFGDQPLRVQVGSALGQRNTSRAVDPPTELLRMATRNNSLRLAYSSHPPEPPGLVPCEEHPVATIDELSSRSAKGRGLINSPFLESEFASFDV